MTEVIKAGLVAKGGATLTIQKRTEAGKVAYYIDGSEEVLYYAETAESLKEQLEEDGFEIIVFDEDI